MTTINDLDAATPGDSDLLSEGPGHIREIKDALKDTFVNWPEGVDYNNLQFAGSFSMADLEEFGTALNIGSDLNNLIVMSGDIVKHGNLSASSNVVLLLMDTVADTISAYTFSEATKTFALDAAAPLSVTGAVYGGICRFNNSQFAAIAEGWKLTLCQLNLGVDITSYPLTDTFLSVTNPAIAKCGFFTGGSSYNAAVLNVGASPWLRMYVTDGAGAFVQVGNSYNFGTTVYSALAYMGAVPNTSPQRHRFVMGTGPINGSRFRIMEWDGTDFIAVSPEVVGPTGGEFDLTAISLTDFLFVSTTGGIRQYRFNGTTIVNTGRIFGSFGGSGSQPTFDASNKQYIFHYDGDTQLLRALKIHYEPDTLIALAPERA